MSRRSAQPTRAIWPSSDRNRNQKIEQSIALVVPFPSVVEYIFSTRVLCLLLSSENFRRDKKARNAYNNKLHMSVKT